MDSRIVRTARSTARTAGILLACASIALVVGCPSKSSKQEGAVVAAPSTPSASASTPRVKVEVFAVRGAASGGTSIEVATKLAYTPKTCDSAKLLPTAGSAGPRRRMTLFRVKDVSLVSDGKTVVASQGGENADDVWLEQEGERAIVIDCIDGAPDARPFPFFFSFLTPEGFDVKRAMLVLEGEKVPLAAFVGK
jgi:hypothetical protein